jgi:hypothetical protein
MRQIPMYKTAHKFALLTKKPAAKQLARLAFGSTALAAMLCLGACQSAQATITDIDSLAGAESKTALKSAQHISITMEQDSNEVTQAKVAIDGEVFELSLTAEELGDPALLKQRVALLPDNARESLLNAIHNTHTHHINQHKINDYSSDKHTVIKVKELDEPTKAKLASLYQKLAEKQRVIEKEAAVIDIDSKAIEAKSAEIEAIANQLAKQSMTLPTADEHDMQVARLREQLAQKTQELEQIMGTTHKEVNIRIANASQGLDEIVQQIVDIETQGRGLDKAHKVIVIKDDSKGMP